MKSQKDRISIIPLDFFRLNVTLALSVGVSSFSTFGRVAESADARDLKSLVLNGRAGSNPASATCRGFGLLAVAPYFLAICLIFKTLIALA